MCHARTVRAQPVYLVWHSIDPDDDDTAKLLGVFSTHLMAEERVARAQQVAGFADYPEGFIIDEYMLDKDAWVEGFVEIDPDEWMAGQDKSAEPG